LPPENDYFFKKGETLITFESVNHKFTPPKFTCLINSLSLLNPSDIPQIDGGLR
jgi:hypothetical protein